MNPDRNIILHSVTATELQELLTKLIRAEFERMNLELQQVMGEDDLISSGTAKRLLGVCSKILKYLVDEGHFTVFYHLRERRYRRSEILAYRNKYMVNKRIDL